MTDSGERLDRFIERVASLGAATGLHPSALLQEVHDAAVAAVRDHSVPNSYLLLLAPADIRALEAHTDELRAGITRMLEELVASRGLRTLGPWQVELEEAPTMSTGGIAVRVAFRNPASPNVVPAQSTETIRRHRGVFLVIDGADRVPLTHTPFTIGRAPGCDLVLHDLAVSRRHARIESGPDGSLSVRDLGSRNKLGRAGRAFDELPFAPGETVRLGSIELTLEVLP